MRIFFFLFLFCHINVYANIQVSPHRIFLSKVSPELSSAMLYVINKADKPVSYRISLKFVNGDESGTIVPLPDAENAKLNEMFARTIMYSPKQIVDLKSKEVQSVRFTIRPPRDIENLQDEYLAMITFTPINVEPIVDNSAKEKTGVSTQVVVAISVRVPLRITFTSNPDYTSTIEDILYEKKDAQDATLNFNIVNKTNFTPYGSVSILTYDVNPSDAVEVATIPAIIIPNPATFVNIKQQLTESSIKKLKKKIIIRYNSFTPLKAGNANTVIAEKTIDV